MKHLFVSFGKHVSNTLQTKLEDKTSTSPKWLSVPLSNSFTLSLLCSMFDCYQNVPSQVSIVKCSLWIVDLVYVSMSFTLTSWHLWMQIWRKLHRVRNKLQRFPNWKTFLRLTSSLTQFHQSIMNHTELLKQTNPLRSGPRFSSAQGAQMNKNLRAWSNHQSHWWSHPIPRPFQWLSPDWSSEDDFHFRTELMHVCAPTEGSVHSSTSTADCKQLPCSKSQNFGP